MPRLSTGRRENGEGSSARTNRYRRRQSVRIRDEVLAEQREEEEESDTNVPVTIEDDLRAPKISPAYEPGDSNGFDATCCDPDVFDCYICCELLSPPIFQCINGHVACGTCSSKMKKCGMCSMPIDYRCPAMEKLLESLKTTCGNKPYGCDKVVRYLKKHEHEKRCFFAPCLCPHAGCNFRANSEVLASHFISDHPLPRPSFNYGELFAISLPRNENVVVLRALADSKLFVIKNEFMSSGNLLELCHIGPNTPNPEFSFEIVAMNLLGNDTVTLQSEVKNVQERTSNLSSSPLFVPLEFFQPYGRLVLEVRITTFGALQL